MLGRYKRIGNQFIRLRAKLLVAKQSTGAPLLVIYIVRCGVSFYQEDKCELSAIKRNNKQTKLLFQSERYNLLGLGLSSSEVLSASIVWVIVLED